MPRSHGGGHVPCLANKYLKLLRAEIARSPDKTILALRDQLEERTSFSVSTPTVGCGERRAIKHARVPPMSSSGTRCHQNAV